VVRILEEAKEAKAITGAVSMGTECWMRKRREEQRREGKKRK
jgi:hypothetical protein